eukprot:3780614-Pleurochrysis_carterae.AAC.1
MEARVERVVLMEALALADSEGAAVLEAFRGAVEAVDAVVAVELARAPALAPDGASGDGPPMAPLPPMDAARA